MWCPYCKSHVRNVPGINYTDDELSAVHSLACPGAIPSLTHRKRNGTPMPTEPTDRCYSLTDEERADTTRTVEHLHVDTGLDLDDDNVVIETRHCAWCRVYEQRVHDVDGHGDHGPWTVVATADDKENAS